MSEISREDSVMIQNEITNESHSRFDRYCELVIGKKGFCSFVKYELIVLFCSRLPGALGLWMRSKLYPSLLGRCGKNVIFGSNVVLRHPHKICIGDDAVIDDNCLIDAKGRKNKGIEMGSGCFLGRNSILSCKEGDIILEDGVNIGFNAEVFSGSKVTIGADTLLSAYCYVIGGGHASSDSTTPIAKQNVTSSGIIIGKDCWMGAGAKILDGVEIEDHSLVGAGAVVTKNLHAGSVAAGVPAKIIRTRKNTPQKS